MIAAAEVAKLRFAAVHLEPDLDAIAVTVVARPSRSEAADVLEKVVSMGTSLGRPFGTHLDAQRLRSRRARARPIMLADVDLLAAFGRVGGLKLALRAQAEQPYLGVQETRLDALAARRVERALDAVLVAGPQLYGLESSGLQILDDGVNVPVVQDVIGDGAQSHVIPLQ